MSPDHEPSYYEIALTNRQVVTIFVVLLTCLVAAFLSGVWIGRRDGGERPVVASVAEATTEPEAAQLTELNFFTDGSTAGGRGEAESNPPSRPAPAGDEPVAQSPVKAPSAPPAKALSSPPAKAQGAPPPAPERPPATTESAPPAGQPPSPQTPPGSAAGRVIQVFSTIDAAQADQLVRRLGEGGYPAYLVEESLQGRTTYRVRVGPYQQEARALKIAEELRREYRLETWITSQSG